VKVDLAALLEPKRLAQRKLSIARDRTHAAASFRGLESGTHHLSVFDREGNAVALTTTINTAFGADLLAPESGVILNDQLDDFTSEQDARSFASDNPNRARPGARPLSSMTPTVVLEQGRVVLVIGGSGGAAIPPNVIEVLLAHLAFDEPIDQALAAPRFQPVTGVPTLRLEDEWSPRTRAELAWRGERLAAVTSRTVAVQAIVQSAAGVQAAADPRKHGVAAAR
jgi:gamma-glutamyltranspeptidase/glutathione hydrolase